MGFLGVTPALYSSWCKSEERRHGGLKDGEQDLVCTFAAELHHLQPLHSPSQNSLKLSPLHPTTNLLRLADSPEATTAHTTPLPISSKEAHNGSLPFMPLQRMGAPEVQSPDMFGLLHHYTIHLPTSSMFTRPWDEFLGYYYVDTCMATVHTWLDNIWWITAEWIDSIQKHHTWGDMKFNEWSFICDCSFIHASHYLMLPIPTISSHQLFKLTFYSPLHSTENRKQSMWCFLIPTTVDMRRFSCFPPNLTL